MKMIPDTPYSSAPLSEKRVFDSLRASFQGPKYSEYTAFHSLNLTSHAYKRFGEIDFLICCPLGIYVIEVKGGRVSCKDGRWQFSNRYGNGNSSPEGPFKQAHSALQGLMQKLGDKLPISVVNQFAIGYGVILPDCDLDSQSSEWDPQMIKEASCRTNLESWLINLMRYWRNKDHADRRANSEAIKLVRQYLRPQFESVAPLHTLIDYAEQQIAQLTEDQMHLVDVVFENDRVLCRGGAGTGKTFLAMELARRLTASGNQVALLCQSKCLSNYLSSRFKIPNLVVSHTDGLAANANRAGISKFDYLIIDEGQDLLQMQRLDIMDSFLVGGLTAGRWCFFHDINNQSGFYGASDPEALAFLESLNATKIPLKTNCRNTRVILDKIKLVTGSDMGVKGAGEGPAVREHHSSTSQSSAQLLETELKHFIDGGLSPGQITILSPSKFDQSCVSLLPISLQDKIAVLDEYSMYSFPSPKISFADTGSFKGLENDAVIVVDLPIPSGDQTSLVHHYVGMSRARAMLSIIYADLAA
jgi:hypothetical protein